MPKKLHGLGTTKEYKVWHNVKRRMSEKLCPDWTSSFENFYHEMGPCPTGMRLCRADSTKEYSISNCTWSTPGNMAISLLEKAKTASGYVGVYQPKGCKSFIYSLTLGGKRYTSGKFPTALDASVARYEKIQTLLGESSVKVEVPSEQA